MTRATRTTTPMPTRSGQPRVLIVSAAMGAGHDGVAHELERRLEARGAQADVVDYLTMLPFRAGPFYKGFYAGQLKYAPSSYEWLYGVMDKSIASPFVRWLGQQGKHKVHRVVRKGDYDVVLSTYPLGCQATGALRRSGKLGVPAVGFLTDVDVHGLWLHPGIDLNLTVWDGSADVAHQRVGVASHAVGPVLPQAFREPVSAQEREDARGSLGLGDSPARVVLLVAGSWGVGDVAGTARAIAESGAGIPVVLCGRNTDLLEELETEFATTGVGIALGWTKDVRRLLAASDVVVHNAGGLSSLESFAVGVPVIGHACLPGHGVRNAEAMRDAGVAELAEDTGHLVRLVKELAGTAEGAAMAARARDLFRSDPTDELLTLATSPVPAARRPVHSPTRTWGTRLAAAGIGVPVALGVVSAGVASAASVTHRGAARPGDAVYSVAMLDSAQTRDPRVVAALQRYRVSAATGNWASAPSPADLSALSGRGITVVAVDRGGRVGDPRAQGHTVGGTLEAVGAATGDRHPKVVCLHSPSVVGRVYAWEHRVWIAQPQVVLTGGQRVPDLKSGAQVVLDERGRTAVQVASDLAALEVEATEADLPQEPMRALWPQHDRAPGVIRPRT